MTGVRIQSFKKNIFKVTIFQRKLSYKLEFICLLKNYSFRIPEPSGWPLVLVCLCTYQQQLVIMKDMVQHLVYRSVVKELFYQLENASIYSLVLEAVVLLPACCGSWEYLENHWDVPWLYWLTISGDTRPAGQRTGIHWRPKLCFVNNMMYS